MVARATVADLVVSRCVAAAGFGETPELDIRAGIAPFMTLSDDDNGWFWQDGSQCCGGLPGLEQSAPPIFGSTRKQLQILRVHKVRRANAGWPRRRAEAWPLRCSSAAM